MSNENLVERVLTNDYFKSKTSRYLDAYSHRKNMELEKEEPTKYWAMPLLKAAGGTAASLGAFVVGFPWAQKAAKNLGLLPDNETRNQRQRQRSIYDLRVRNQLRARAGLPPVSARASNTSNYVGYSEQSRPLSFATLPRPPSNMRKRIDLLGDSQVSNVLARAAIRHKTWYKRLPENYKRAAVSHFANSISRLGGGGLLANRRWARSEKGWGEYLRTLQPHVKHEYYNRIRPHVAKENRVINRRKKRRKDGSYQVDREQGTINQETPDD